MCSAVVNSFNGVYMKKNLKTLLALGLFSLGLGVQAGLGTALAGPSDNSLVIGASQEPVGIEPFAVNQSIASEIYRWMYRNLTYVDLEGRPQADLASELPTEANGRVKFVRDKNGDPTSMTVRWTLRDGLRWSDNRPIVSDDVEWTYNTFMDNRLPVPNRANAPKKFTQIDDKTFELTYEPINLFYQFDPVVGNYIAPKHVWAPLWESVKPQLAGKTPDQIRDIVQKQFLGSAIATSRQGPPVTSGPFRFQKWVPGQSFTMVRNPNYWQQNPNGVQRITYRFIQNTNTLQVNLLSGQIDATAQVSLANSPQTLLTLRQSARGIYNVSQVAGSAFEHLHINKWSQVAPVKELGLDDIRTRQALAYAIDRKTLSNELLGGTVVSTNTFVNKSSPVYSSAYDAAYPYDPERAKKMLADLGWKAGSDGILEREVGGKTVKFVIEFVTTAGNTVRERNQQFIGDNFKKVGIGIKINNSPSAVVFGTDFIPRASEGRWTGMFEFAWSSNPITEQGNLWYCDDPLKTVREDGRPSAANGYQGQNHGGWCNREYDKLWDKARKETNAADRKQLFSQMQKLFVEELPVIPLYSRLEILTTRKGLNNYVWNGPTQSPSMLGWLVGWEQSGQKVVVKQPEVK
jgi:peptide/nickel transport system substrate-binding protein